MKLTLKQKIAVFSAVGAVLVAMSAVGTLFGVKKYKAAKITK